MRRCLASCLCCVFMSHPYVVRLLYVVLTCCLQLGAALLLVCVRECFLLAIRLLVVCLAFVVLTSETEVVLHLCLVTCGLPGNSAKQTT